jgi:DNA-binding MarR family transcriptional regulator
MKQNQANKEENAAVDNPDVSSRDCCIGHQLIEFYDVYVRFLSSRTRSKLMKLNLTQWRTLSFIRFNPNKTQRALSTAVGIDPSSMTPIIDFFEGKRWVRRRQSPTNRSAYELRLTAAGLKAYQKVESEINELEEIFTQVLGADKRDQFAAGLMKLHDQLASLLTPDAS